MAATDSRVKPCRVLIVDDEKRAANTLATVLTEYGHTVEVVYDGMAAVRSAEHFKPDLVLLDLVMPDVDGFETCRRLREVPWGRAIYIVALTAWEQEDAARTERSGFDLYVMKPVDFDELQQVLQRCAPAASKDDRNFVSGYSCPYCGLESIGIEQHLTDRRRSIWDFRAEATGDLEIVCSGCEKQVPRSHWTYSQRR